MTLANKITIIRLLLIPVFVVFAAYYSASLSAGKEEISYRIAALVVFAIASLSDALDGYIARNYNQSTPLGRFLDPVADKLLLLAGVVTLSVTHWNVIIALGVLILHLTNGKARIKNLMVGKMCTFLQLSCVCWVLIDFWSINSRPWPLEVLIYLAAALTLITGYLYLRDGIHQLRESGHTHPDPDVP